MAHPSTLYRFKLDISDVDRGVYEVLDLRVAMHPSETPVYFITRLLAFALNAQEGLEFTPGGLSDPDEPSIRLNDSNGAALIWIEIGNPNPRKLHKAGKASKGVKVYTYKDPEGLLREIRAAEVYRADRLEIFSFDSRVIERLAETLERNNEWSLIHTDGSLTVNIGEMTEQFEIGRHAV
jgi:uncharacterized protein YaeQ